MRAPVTADELTELQAEVLEFAKIRWKYLGAQEGAIRERWDFGATRYFQILNDLLDNPLALAAEPQLIRQLQRIRDVRREKRSARARGFDL